MTLSWTRQMKKFVPLLVAALAACRAESDTLPVAPQTARAVTAAIDDASALARGMAHYCSKVALNSTAWSVTYGTADPCAAGLPGGVIMRAGMYSIAGVNRVVVHCQPTYIKYHEGVGQNPINQARNAAMRTGSHSGKCTFTVAPKRMPLFDLPYPPNANLPANYHGSGFDFWRPPYGDYNVIDHRGQSVSFINDHDAHDFGMPKGTPLLAVADGVIITAGMFWGQYTNCNSPRGIEIPTRADCGRQGIVIVRHTVQAALPTYDEVFATGYFHVQSIPKWIRDQCTAVDTTLAWPGVGGVCSIPVKRGQVVAYSGRRNTSLAHLHFATWKLTNTHANGHRVGDAALYSPSCCTQGGRGPTMIVEPSGWYGSTPDPWATRAILSTPQFPAGAGTLSIHLWKADPPFHW
jgi:murein DD-endopeptidase MepM/ murein hydrolase activator NlpD